MRLEELKANFADNIKTIREKAGLTQLQLGERLNFSDKTISKWENGDVMPDVATLDHIASSFNITVNDLIYGKTSIEVQNNKRNLLIIASTFFGIMAFACLCYILLVSFTDVSRAWLVFLCAPITFFISMLVLSAVFLGYKTVIVAISCLTWSIAIAIFFTFLSQGLWMVFLIAGILQIFFFLLGKMILLYKSKDLNKN